MEPNKPDESIPLEGTLSLGIYHASTGNPDHAVFRFIDNDGTEYPVLDPILARAVRRLSGEERNHRDLVSFAGRVLGALDIDGEQDNAGNLALDRIRQLINIERKIDGERDMSDIDRDLNSSGYDIEDDEPL